MGALEEKKINHCLTVHLTALCGISAFLTFVGAHRSNGRNIFPEDAGLIIKSSSMKAVVPLAASVTRKPKLTT